MRSRPVALTLAEIVVAIGILAVVSLSVIAMFSKLLSAGGKQSNQTVARRLATKVLAKSVKEATPGWDAHHIIEGEVELKSQRTDLTTLYLYEAVATRLQAANESVGPLYHVRVKVNWWPDSTDANGSRQGQGKLYVEADRMIYLGK